MKNLAEWIGRRWPIEPANAQSPHLPNPLERISRDPEAEPFVALFRPGDVCGDCGQPLDVADPETASCPNCGRDPFPF